MINELQTILAEVKEIRARFNKRQSMEKTGEQLDAIRAVYREVMGEKLQTGTHEVRIANSMMRAAGRKWQADKLDNAVDMLAAYVAKLEADEKAERDNTVIATAMKLQRQQEKAQEAQEQPQATTQATTQAQAPKWEADAQEAAASLETADKLGQALEALETARRALRDLPWQRMASEAEGHADRAYDAMRTVINETWAAIESTKRAQDKAALRLEKLAELQALEDPDGPQSQEWESLADDLGTPDAPIQSPGTPRWFLGNGWMVIQYFGHGYSLSHKGITVANPDPHNPHGANFPTFQKCAEFAKRACAR